MSFTKLYFFILTFQKPTIYNDPNAFNSGIPFLSILMEHRQFSNSRYSLFNRDDQVAFVEILGRPQECKTLPHRENRQEIYRQPLPTSLRGRENCRLRLLLSAELTLMTMQDWDLMALITATLLLPKTVADE
ncbi:predicted protein [Histoplasma capsulatum G186AR]|uniref:Uncharacterized protein n=1 Tax=Ajellomyces capsulatus (strain G186AR / H82 / ATCC MYA-2454 / RMSCC 2432) TaxID=447093 RepID=C0NJK3_AJECG|nr:uncharacterized protein HCBG_03333 [Histoplasma capsulatum G186AR]EEH08044.1 predicted protein [Histoplasma capsulatum G186AR]